MGVRINSSATAAKASTQQVATKKDAGQPAGTDTDFSHVLAKAQPKKKADAAPESDKPVSDKSTSAEKVAGKKPTKGKAKAEQSDDSQPAVPSDVTPQATINPEADEATPVADVDDAIPVAEIDGDAASDDTQHDDLAADNETQPVVRIDPPQVVVQAAPVQVQTPQEVVAAGGVKDDKPASPVQAQSAATQAPAAKITPAPVPADGPKAAEEPVEGKPVEHHDVDAPKPVPTAEATKVAVQPIADQTRADAGDSDDAGRSEVQTPQVNGAETSPPSDASVSRFAELFRDLSEEPVDDKSLKAVGNAPSPAEVALMGVAGDHAAPKAVEAPQAKAAPVPVAPEVRFAEDNHPKVVTAVKTQMLPGGGSIQLRLDPPDLGPLRLEVRMEDGTMSASFVTASDQATSLLTHSLGQLKHALEGAGISVDKLQVRQGSADQFTENSDQRQQQGGTGDQSSARQEQQRREMLNRMWQKVAGGDPLDLVA